MLTESKNGSLKWLIGSLATLSIVAGVGWQANNTINNKANASDLVILKDKVLIIETTTATKDDIAKLQRKIDRLLIKNGINPDTIQ